MRGTLLVALLLLPAVQGLSWDDDLNDVRITMISAQGEQELSNDQDWYAHYDIASVAVEETEDTIVFTVVPRKNFQEDGPSAEPGVANHVYPWIFFDFHGEPRSIQGIWWIYDRDHPTSNYLHTLDEGEWIRDVRVSEEPLESHGWTLTLRKWDLRNPDNVPARVGDVLENIRVEFFSDPGGPAAFTCIVADASDPSFEDQCGIQPSDDSAAPEDFVLTLSPGGIEDVYLESPAPLRASNGIATTYVFDVDVHNLADADRTIHFHANDVPPEWTVRHPERIPVEAGGKQTVSVLLDVPFQHQHGSEQQFNFTATGTSTHQVPLGVVWTAVPQISGHHPDLYFHSPGYSGWMNTLEVDEAARTRTIEPRTSYTEGVNDDNEVFDQNNVWSIPLRPGLAMGLDGLPGEPVTGTVRMESPYDWDVRSGTIELLYVTGDAEPLVLASQPFPAGVIGPDQPLDLELDMPWSVEGDLLPFRSDANLRLDMQAQGVADTAGYTANTAGIATFIVDAYTGNNPQPPGRPYIDGSASRMTLPLLDYHDIIGGTIASEADVEEAEATLDEAEAKPTPLPLLPILFLLLWMRRR